MGAPSNVGHVSVKYIYRAVIKHIDHTRHLMSTVTVIINLQNININK